MIKNEIFLVFYKGVDKKLLAAFCSGKSWTSTKGKGQYDYSWCYPKKNIDSGNNEVVKLKITFQVPSSSNPEKFIEVILEKGLTKELTFHHKKTISNEELSLFGDIQKVTVQHCDTFNLRLQNRFKHNEVKVKKLGKIQELVVWGCENFKVDLCEMPENLDKLSVYWCDKFNKNSTAVKKLEKKGCKVFAH